MKIRDYYLGQPVTLRSPLKPDQLKQCINEAAKVVWWRLPFHIGPVGRFWFGRLRLRYATSPFEYNAKPVLTGGVEQAPAGSILRLEYRGRTWSRIFFVIWYAFLALFSVGFLILGTDPPLHGEERLAPFAIASALADMPILMHAIGTRNSNDELRKLIDFLEQVADAHQGTPKGPI